MKIAFTGDLFTGGQLIDDYSSKKIDIEEFISADLRVSNLEQATSDRDYEVEKSSIFSPLKGIDFLVENKINIVSLANNHIQDKGESGFLDSISFLKKKNIQYMGAGCNFSEASRPIAIGENKYLLAYCDFNRPSLNKVQISTHEKYGINPLHFNSIIRDLEKIPENSKAIIFVHWGIENLWFPAYDNIILAKKILEQPKVHSIIGTHPHRVLGKIKHNGKLAYLSLGNFLYPNFYLAPRTRLVYPKVNEEEIKSTREYHPVFTLTLKKWKYSNRVSLLLVLNNNQFNEIYIKQKKGSPELLILKGKENSFWKFHMSLLTVIYRLPKLIYIIVASIINSSDKIIKYFNIFCFYLFKEKKFLSVFKL